MIPPQEFRAYMKAANRTSDNHDNHLSEAQVIAYCRSEMSEAEYETAQTHLLACEQCIALFRNARDFVEPARADEGEVTVAETNEAWQSLRPHLQTAATTAASPRRLRWLMDSRATLALAASLLISFGALAWFTWRYRQEQQSRRHSEEIAAQLANRQKELEQQLSQLQQSGGDQLKQEREQRLAAEAKRDQLQSQLAAAQQAWQNIPVYTRTLSSERGTADSLQLSFNAESPAVLLRLIRGKPFEYSEYAIQLFDQHDKLIQEFSGLRPGSDDGALSVLLNRAIVGAGSYKLRLFGQSGKTKNELGEYKLAVTVAR
jgi:hypothetical protein